MVVIGPIPQSVAVVLGPKADHEFLPGTEPVAGVLECSEDAKLEAVAGDVAIALGRAVLDDVPADGLSSKPFVRSLNLLVFESFVRPDAPLRFVRLTMRVRLPPSGVT
ncbi:hypothetical protein ACFQL1_15855 [Halomicroarcula sp. GCM10025709]|uniref:hypothetical protein n=1 Tax=Halomicroarcula sp. GCM10025709 TaxID=3252669 RepID=UPI0036100D69